jgi:hypothetical protein
VSGSLGGGLGGGVGAAFVIDDKATSALIRISEGFEKVQEALTEATTGARAFSDLRFGGVTRSLGALTDQFDEAATAADRLKSITFGNVNRSISALDQQVAALGASMDTMAATFETAMTKVAGEALRGEAAVNSLEAAMARTAATARGLGAAAGGIQVPGMAGGGGRGGVRGGGRGGGGGEPHARMHMSPAGVGAGASMALGGPMTMGALGAGMLMYHGVDEAAKWDLAVRNTLMNLGVADPDSPEGRQLRPIVEQGLRDAARGTIFSVPELAPAGADFAGIFASAVPEQAPGTLNTPEQKARAMAGIEGRVFRFAETETQMGHGTLEENMKAGVYLSHLTRQYTPEGLGASLDRLLAISRMTGASPEEIERIMKYSVTTGGLAGVNPTDIMTSTGFLIQSGITGSTAGTGLAQVIQSIIQGEAPAPGHRRRALTEDQTRTNLEHALHGTIGLGRDRQRGETEDAHSRRLGALRELGILGADAKPARGMANERGDLLIFPIIEALSKYADTHSTRELAIKESEAFSVRAGRATEPFIGKEQLKLFQQYRQQETEFTEKVGVLATQAGQAASAMQQMQQVWARFNDLMVAAFTPLDRLGGAAKGAADGLDRMAAWFTAHPGVFGDGTVDVKTATHPGTALREVTNQLWDSVTSFFTGKPVEHPMLAPGARTDHPPPFTLEHPADPHNAPLLQRESYRSGGAQVHIQNINFGPGTPREHADQFARELAAALSRAQMNDLGTGYGHTNSAYSTGKPLSI